MARDTRCPNRAIDWTKGGAEIRLDAKIAAEINTETTIANLISGARIDEVVRTRST